MITIDSRLHAIGMKAAAALIEGVTNSPSDATLTTAINKRVEALRGKFPPDGPRAWREVSSLQGVYRQIGASWRNNRPSIERLGMMIAKGRNLPSINSVVDIYNIASLENRMCMGAHDADVLKMPVSLRETLGSEEFVPLGGETERVPASEFAYFDNAGRIICRLDAVQADFSKVGQASQRVLLIVEGSPISGASDVFAVADRTASEIAKATGGVVREIQLAT